jgi:hypothetical protein
MSMYIQIVKSEHLHEIYSCNPKINNIVRALHALHDKDGLWKAVAEYLYSPEAMYLTAQEIGELYEATKWVIYAA